MSPRPCRPADLQIRGGREGNGSFGYASATIQFTNNGTDACRLRGMPAVIVRRHGSGARLPLHYSVSHRATLKSRTLAPGVRWTAAAGLLWSNWCGPAIHRLDVLVRIPPRGKVEASFDGPPAYNEVPGCLHATRPSRLVLLSAYEKS